MIGSFFNPFVNKIIPSYKVSICIVCFLLPTAESDNFKLLGSVKNQSVDRKWPPGRTLDTPALRKPFFNVRYNLCFMYGALQRRWCGTQLVTTWPPSDEKYLFPED